MPEVKLDGVTIPWEPDDQSKIATDVCFVHGLGGHPRKTWQYRSENPKKRSFVSRIFDFSNKKARTEQGEPDDSTEPAYATGRSCYWPFDLLRSDFLNIRVMTYGYDSNPTRWYKGKTTQMTIDQHTQTLLQGIGNSRALRRQRPIIFVAHSLGGILVKNAIIFSAKYKLGNLYLWDISESCHAILFFGTPNRGTGSAKLGAMIANVIGTLPCGPSVDNNILRSLEPDSEKLASIITDFNYIMEDNVPPSDKIQIYSFQEGQGYCYGSCRWEGVVTSILTILLNPASGRL